MKKIRTYDNDNIKVWLRSIEIMSAPPSKPEISFGSNQIAQHLMALDHFLFYRGVDFISINSVHKLFLSVVFSIYEVVVSKFW